jgi:hypothetical protein
MFKFTKNIFGLIGSKIYRAKEQNREREHLKKIKLPVLKQTLPLSTSHTEVSEARTRVLELNQSIHFLTGIALRFEPGFIYALDLVFFRQLTHKEERLFKEAVGNVSVQMSVGVGGPREH